MLEWRQLVELYQKKQWSNGNDLYEFAYKPKLPPGEYLWVVISNTR